MDLPFKGQIVTLLPIPKDGALAALICLACLFGVTFIVMLIERRRERLDRAAEARRFLAGFRRDGRV